MALQDKQLREALAQADKYSVFYFYSTEEYRVRSYAARTLAALTKDGDAEVTRVEGPAPDIGAVVAATGTISLFGTKRVVELPLMEPSAMSDADAAALADLMGSLENAVLVLTTVFKDDKAKQTKKAKALIAAAQKNGLAGDVLVPGPADARRFVAGKAEELGAQMSPAAATALVERSGTDLFLLSCEVEKLAAASGYGAITPELVSAMGTQNIEADVFELVRLVTAQNSSKAFSKLQQLLELQNEPIAIAAALSGAFIDMYRVKVGAATHHNIAAVQKDFGYRGSDWRLRKSGESAARYSQKQLETILEALRRLDRLLKSSAADRAVLLQTTLAEILQVGVRA